MKLIPPALVSKPAMISWPTTPRISRSVRLLLVLFLGQDQPADQVVAGDLAACAIAAIDVGG